MSGSAPGLPAGPADLVPGAVQPDADGVLAPAAINVIDQENLYLLRPNGLFL